MPACWRPSLVLNGPSITALVAGVLLAPRAVISQAPPPTNQTTTTTLSTTAPNAAVVSGDYISLIATVNGQSTAPVGNVTFKDGTTLLGTKSLAAISASQSAATLTLNSGSLAIGVHSITAQYLGATVPTTQTTTSTGLVVYNVGVVYAPSTSNTFGIDVLAKSLASVAITPSGSALSSSQLTFSATVQAATVSGLVPTGQVRFLVNGTVFGTANLACPSTLVKCVSPQAVLAPPIYQNATGMPYTFPGGRYQLTAVYLGSNMLAPSTSAATAFTTLMPTQTSMTYSVPASTFNSLPAFDPGAAIGVKGQVAQVLWGNTLQQLTDGYVAYNVDGQEKSRTTIGSGVGLTGLAPGQRSITSAFVGDATHATSLSPAWLVFVRAPTSTRISLSPKDTLHSGTSLTVTVTVSSSQTGTDWPPPAGFATITSTSACGSNGPQSANLTNGQASLVWPAAALCLGQMTFTAKYGYYTPAQYVTSTSSPVSLIVVR